MTPGAMGLARFLRRAVIEKEAAQSGLGEGACPVETFLVYAQTGDRRNVLELRVRAGDAMSLAEAVLGPVTDADRDACRSRTDESVRPLVSRRTKNPPADAVFAEDLDEEGGAG